MAKEDPGSNLVDSGVHASTRRKPIRRFWRRNVRPYSCFRLTRANHLLEKVDIFALDILSTSLPDYFRILAKATSLS